MKKLLFFSCVLFSVQAVSIHAAQNPALSRELAIKSENNEQDIRMLKERVETQESVIDSISEKVSSFLKNADALQKTTKDKLQHQSKDLDHKFQALVDDLKKLKNQANETAQTIEKMFSKFKEQEDVNAKISSQIEKIEDATRSLAKAMQSSFTDIASNGDRYIVKNGDTLEKISKNHGISIKELKDLNHLEKDTIFAGQKLKVSKE